MRQISEITRTRIAIKRTRHLLNVIYDYGTINRGQLYDIFQRHLSSQQLDALLADPLLAGLICISQSPRRRRYFMTAVGWLVVTALRQGAQLQPITLSPSDVRNQFARLVAERDVWATGLVRGAAKGQE